MAVPFWTRIHMCVTAFPTSQEMFLSYFLFTINIFGSSPFLPDTKLCLPPDKLLFYFVWQQTSFPKMSSIHIEIHHSCRTCVYSYLSQSTIPNLLRFGGPDVVILQVQTFGMCSCSCLNDRGNCCALTNVNTVNFIGFTYTNIVHEQGKIEREREQKNQQQW